MPTDCEVNEPNHDYDGTSIFPLLILCPCSKIGYGTIAELPENARLEKVCDGHDVL